MLPDYNDSDQHKKSHSFSVRCVALYKPAVNFHKPTKTWGLDLKSVSVLQATQGRNISVVAFLIDLFTVMKKLET